jgi:hypothetical protein
VFRGFPLGNSEIGPRLGNDRFLLKLSSSSVIRRYIGLMPKASLNNPRTKSVRYILDMMGRRCSLHGGTVVSFDKGLESRQLLHRELDMEIYPSLTICDIVE